MSKPILFNEEMITALGDGMKTQTRRAIKLPRWATGWQEFQIGASGEPLVICKNTGVLAEIPSPYGKAGETLWVREAWRTHQNYNAVAPRDLPEHAPVQYKEDLTMTGSVGAEAKWRPSIFMPKWASRFTLVLTRVTVQQLQDLSLADVLEEGCPIRYRPLHHKGKPDAAFGWFRCLWDGINGQRGFGWDVNPWIWAVEFALRIERSSNEL